jgi:uncharacterized protein DUF2784
MGRDVATLRGCYLVAQNGAVITLVLGAHFAYVAYVVLGGFLAWWWPRAIWPHAAPG